VVAFGQAEGEHKTLHIYVKGVPLSVDPSAF